VTLRSPDACILGHVHNKVTETRRRTGYIARRHRCLTCGRRWTSYESLIHPHHVVVKPRPTRYL
jgi:transcriptional regulator NrdR family protein